MDLLISLSRTVPAPGRRAPTRRLSRLVPALLLHACVPDVDIDEAIVRAPRLLAVQAEPAEAQPGQPVTYQALVVGPSGLLEDATLDWFTCRARKPLAELGPIHPDCLHLDRGSLEPIGRGLEAEAALPTDACSLFGPNPPPPSPGEPPGRPVDPDPTGGYSVPVVIGVRASDDNAVVLHEQRVICGLAGVGPSDAIAFRTRYHANRNPNVSALRAAEGEAEAHEIPIDTVLEVAVGSEVRLSVAWPRCPEQDACGDDICGPDESASSCADDCATPLGCGGRERYLWFDAERGELAVRREAMRVAWYATGGALRDERTGVDEDADAAQSTSANVWLAPEDSGEHTLWVVLRDARGGVATREVKVRVADSHAR